MAECEHRIVANAEMSLHWFQKETEVAGTNVFIAVSDCFVAAVDFPLRSVGHTCT